ncbi:MAG: wax ester/triacylglycerol synthase domain-containing protein [Dermatophilaceae bacterium]
MTSTERIFLRLERRGYPMDIVGITVLAPHDEGPLPFRVLYGRMNDATRLSPHLTRRLSRAPLGIGEDHWIEAEDFDLDEHVHHIECPAPGDTRALLDLVLEITDEPLNRSRPLWVAWYVSGMAGGRTALLFRAHHALTDGLGFMKLYDHVFDADDQGTPPAHQEASSVPLGEALGAYIGPENPQVGEHEPPALLRAAYEVPERMAHTVVTSSRIARTLVGGVPSAVGGVAARVARTVGDAIAMAGAEPEPEPESERELEPEPPEVSGAPGSTPREDSRGGAGRRGAHRRLTLPRFIPSPTDHPPVTRFQAHITDTTKCLSVASVPMAEIETARTCCPGATVNDVILAMATGALRSYLSAHDELPDEPLLTTCPVSVRKDGHSEGNAFTTIWVELPVHVEDPLERLRAVHASANRSKAGVRASLRSWDVLADVGDLLLPGMVSAVMAFAGSKVFTRFPPTLNLSVSTMRSATTPYYLGRRRVEHMYARTIVCPPVHLFVHAITYAGSAELGVLSLREVLPDPDALAAGLRAELDLLLRLAPES